MNGKQYGLILVLTMTAGLMRRIASTRFLQETDATSYSPSDSKLMRRERGARPSGIAPVAERPDRAERAP
jgi:hypothetical protein